MTPDLSHVAVTSVVQLSLHLIYLVANSKSSCFISRSITYYIFLNEECHKKLNLNLILACEGVRINYNTEYKLYIKQDSTKVVANWY
jgi:hypothetical protein